MSSKLVILAQSAVTIAATKVSSELVELRCRFAPLNKVKLNTLLANISDAEALLQKGR